MTLDPRKLMAVALLALGVVLVYWQVLRKLVFDWGHDDNYSHGFLIVPIALYLVWERRARLATITPRPTWFGLVVFAGGILILLAGLLGSELFLSRISMLGVLAGMILFLFGWSHFRALIFPLMFLLLMIPLPAIIFNQIAFPLQIFASRTGEFVIRSADIPVFREGNVLVLANTSLEVAEACSGIRSLISLLTLGIVFGYFTDRRGWVRTIIALSTIPVAIISNGARVAGTGIAAHRWGPSVAEGFLHEFSGWVVFMTAFALMLGLQQLIVRLAPAARMNQTAKAAAA
jgi:exosortase A